MSDEKTPDLLMNPAHIDDEPITDDGVPQSQNEAAMAEFAAASVREMANMLDGFFPMATDAQLVENSVKALNEQIALQPCIIDASFKGSVGKLPGWGVQVGPIVPSITQPAMIIVPKLTADVLGMQTAMHWATVLAFATSPQARASLRLLGYEIKFVQTKYVPGALVRG